MSSLAVAANPPALTGTAPASAGDSSPIVTPADVAGGRDQTFSFSVTFYATATISGTIKDEAHNTIDCALRDALAEENSADLDNGGTITFDRFQIERGLDAWEARLAGQAHAMVEVLRSLTGSVPTHDENGVCNHCGRDNAGEDQSRCAYFGPEEDDNCPWEDARAILARIDRRA